jgi:hypothetical protein
MSKVAIIGNASGTGVFTADAIKAAMPETI